MLIRVRRGADPEPFTFLSAQFLPEQKRRIAPYENVPEDVIRAHVFPTGQESNVTVAARSPKKGTEILFSVWNLLKVIF